MLTFPQKQALLWCIDRENPAPPKSETDHPVQFWQLKQNNGKVNAFFFVSRFVLTDAFPFRGFTSIVRLTPLAIHPPLMFLEVATKTPQETPPQLGRGALCADSMGLCVPSVSPNMC